MDLVIIARAFHGMADNRRAIIGQQQQQKKLTLYNNGMQLRQLNTGEWQGGASVTAD